LGALIGVQLAVHMRHLRNLCSLSINQSHGIGSRSHRVRPKCSSTGFVMGVLRILWFLFDAVRLHAKLVHLGRRSRLFFAWRKAPQARTQTSCKSCQNGSIAPANLRSSA
jgi:hypothetical protein